MAEQVLCDRRSNQRVKQSELASGESVGAFEDKICNAQPDPILKTRELLNRALKEKSALPSLILTIGEIRDPLITDSHIPWKPSVVVEVEKEMVMANKIRGYLMPPGNEEYLMAQGREWIFGFETWQELCEGSEAQKPKNLVWAQAIGGTNALRLALGISGLQLNEDERTVVAESPGWSIHKTIAKEAGFRRIVEIDRRNPDGSWYDHKLFTKVLKDLPPGAVVLLQGSGFNGDGVDKSPAEWDEIASILGHPYKKHTVVLDIAYNGLVNGFQSGLDTYTIRRFLKEENIDLHLAVSNSKNLGMYGARLGAWYYLLRRDRDPVSVERAERIQNYINTEFLMALHFVPPRFPSEVVATILKDKVLRRKTEEEIEYIRMGFIGNNRMVFNNIFRRRFPWVDDSKGIFVTPLANGFSNEAVNELRLKFGYYCPLSSRINLAGIPKEKIEKVAKDVLSVIDSSGTYS